MLQLLDRPGARGANDAGCLGSGLFWLLSIGAYLRRRLDRRMAPAVRLGRVRVAAERRQAGVVSVHDAHGVARATRNVYPNRSHRAVARATVQCDVAPARHAIPARLRFTVLQRDGFRCRYCGRTAGEPGVVLHVDHVVPVAAGGTTIEGNLVTACAECNLGKATRLVVSAGS